MHPGWRYKLAEYIFMVLMDEAMGMDEIENVNNEKCQERIL